MAELNWAEEPQALWTPAHNTPHKREILRKPILFAKIWQSFYLNIFQQMSQMPTNPPNVTAVKAFFAKDMARQSRISAGRVMNSKFFWNLAVNPRRWNERFEAQLAQNLWHNSHGRILSQLSVSTTVNLALTISIWVHLSIRRCIYCYVLRPVVFLLRSLGAYIPLWLLLTL